MRHIIPRKKKKKISYGSVSNSANVIDEINISSQKIKLLILTYDNDFFL